MTSLQGAQILEQRYARARRGAARLRPALQPRGPRGGLAAGAPWRRGGGATGRTARSTRRCGCRAARRTPRGRPQPPPPRAPFTAKVRRGRGCSLPHRPPSPPPHSVTRREGLGGQGSPRAPLAPRCGAATQRLAPHRTLKEALCLARPPLLPSSPTAPPSTLGILSPRATPLTRPRDPAPLSPPRARRRRGGTALAPLPPLGRTPSGAQRGGVARAVPRGAPDGLFPTRGPTAGRRARPGGGGRVQAAGAHGIEWGLPSWVF